jgi:N-acetylglucosaminyldiphosphoundecaprenol N-acetyl-beta-D-mannosaminyltransferase
MIFAKLLTNPNLVIDSVINAISQSESFLMTYLNQHCFNIYNSNEKYKDLLDNSFNYFLDGFGIYLALKFLGYKKIEKFNATDLYAKIFEYFLIKQLPLFLLGGNFTEELIKYKAKEKKLSIAGYQNGYFKESEFRIIVEQIKKSQSELIIIGMGVPMQEIVAEKISIEMKNKVVLCVGGFLEFYFGTKKRAPKVFRSTGFEWLHRLLSEPSRLWRRYLIGIPSFLFYLIKLKF